MEASNKLEEKKPLKQESKSFSKSSQPNTDQYVSVQSSANSSSIKLITPPRYWYCFKEEDFDNSYFFLIENGTFSKVKRLKLRDSSHFLLNNYSTIYSNSVVAIKDPKEVYFNWVKEQYNLSREINCNLILHPYIVNYIGGIRLEKPQRLGVVMEYVYIDLRKAILFTNNFQSSKGQLSVAKQIASGMNFLHSLNPYILHRDLRTPNILVNEELNCKIEDFGNAIIFGFPEIKPLCLYTNLIPPEYKVSKQFTKKGDVYFFGWILIEMLCRDVFFDLQNFQLEMLPNFIQFQTGYQDLIRHCIDKDPEKRFSFSEILEILNELLESRYDLELIAQNNLSSVLLEGIECGTITPLIKDSFDRTLLHQCCIFNNLEMLKVLTKLWGKSYLNQPDVFGNTLYHLASRNGNLEILKFLVSQSLISNDKELRFQMTCLDICIALGHKDCIEFLIEYANQEVLNSALLNSSSEGNLEIVKQVINQGADIECKKADLGATPLDQAAYNGHFEIVKFLVERGALVNQCRVNDIGATPLLMGVQNGHLKITQYLLERGADVNRLCTDGRSPIFVASQNGHKGIVEILLQYKADPNLSLFNGATPLFIASQMGHLEIVQLLLRNGGNPNKSRYLDGTTPLFIACQEGLTEIAHVLLKGGANPNSFCVDGGSPLTISSFKGFINLVEILLHYGADINQRDGDGDTALSNALKNGHHIIVEKLKRKQFSKDS